MKNSKIKINFFSGLIAVLFAFAALAPASAAIYCKSKNINPRTAIIHKIDTITLAEVSE